jgi:outer membrane protein TolC
MAFKTNLMRFTIVILISPLFNLGAYCQHKFETLGELINFADENSEQLEVLKLNVISDKLDLRIANSLKYPYLGITSEFRNNYNIPVTAIPADILGGQSGNFIYTRLGQQYNLTNLVLLNYDLLNPQRILQNRILQYDENQTNINYQLSTNELHAKLAKHYYNYIYYQSLKELALKKKEFLNDLHNKETLVEKEGYNNINFLYKIESQNFKAQSEIGLYSLRIDQERLAISQIINLKINQEFILSERFNLSQTDWTYSPGSSSMKTKYAESIVNQAELELKQTRLCVLPKLSLFGTLGYQQLNNNFYNLSLFKDANSIQAIGLKLDFTIFSGFSVLNNISKAKIALKQRDLQFKETIRESEIYLANMFLYYGYLLEDLKRYQAKYFSNLTNLRVLESRYFENVMTSLDYFEFRIEIFEFDKMFLNKIVEFYLFKSEAELK